MDESPAVTSVSDALSDVSRKERRSLLVLSAVGLFIAKAGLVPSKISALGIDFDQADKKMLRVGISLVILYLITGFLVYAWADFIAWRYRYRLLMQSAIERGIREMKEKAAATAEEREIRQALHWKFIGEGRIIRALCGPTAVVRALFDFLLPLIVGVIAFVALVKNA